MKLAAPKQYRLQRSAHLGVQNTFCGRKAKWSPWKTVAYYHDKVSGECAFERSSGKGLTRWRLIYGTEVIRKSL